MLFFILCIFLLIVVLLPLEIRGVKILYRAVILLWINEVQAAWHS